MGIIRAHKFSGHLDEIDQVIGSHIYATPHYDTTLRDTLLGKHSTDLVPVTRYYFKVAPKVVVDFEPQPGNGRWFCDEKRRFFNERGIVYLGIALRERLTTEEFSRRLKVETEIMQETLRLLDVLPGEVVRTDILTAARAEAFRECEQAVAAGSLTKGPAYDRELVARTRRHITLLNEQNADGRLGFDLRADEPASAAR